MACTPLGVDVGGFFTSEPWSNAPSATFDGKTITLDSAGLVVAQGANSVFHQRLAGRNILYRVLGTKFLVILDVETGAGPTQRSVSVVDFATWTEKNVLTVLASSSAVALPVVNRSAGAGSAFLGYGQNGTEHTSVAIYRSDTGVPLCSIGAPIVPTGQTAGEATATELIIHYSTAGASKQAKCPRPLGKSQITPSSQTFADVFVGGCPFTPQKKQFTIKNVGDDCLTVSAIGNVAPFAVTATSQALPATLAKNETLTVTVEFNPTAPGTFAATALPVTLSPANGDLALTGKGKALPAAFKIAFNGTTVDFGVRQVGTTASKNLVVTNSGSRPLVVSVDAVAADGFATAGFDGTLACGASQSVPITFTPTGEGAHAASISVTSDAPGSPHLIQLKGVGCVPNAAIVPDPVAPIDLGEVQQGFRTVRYIRVRNTGDGPLTFQGAIGGADAALFGLPDADVGSVTSPPATAGYTVLPTFHCGGGGTGSGEAIVAVSFFANDAPRLATATLTLSGHDATNEPAGKTWVYPLVATITPPVALDVALVVDHSGSMNDSLGTRVKMDAAVAASQLFVELLRPNLDDRVAVARFNHVPDAVLAMTPLTTVAVQDQVRQLVQTGVPPAQGNTAIAAGALLGIAQVQTPRVATPAALTKAVVVLSDGIENTAAKDPGGGSTWYSIAGGPMYPGVDPVDMGTTVPTVPMPRPADIGIYAVGLGTGADVDVGQLTALAGDPSHFFHVDKDLVGTKFFDLEKYYTQIFMEIVGLAPVKDPMFWIAPGDRHEIQFDMLQGDVSALVVVFDYQGLRLPFHCESPVGELVDPAMIPVDFQLRAGATTQARFVEFRAPAGQPKRYAGPWKAVVEHQGRVCTGMPQAQGRDDGIGFLPRRCREFDEPVLYGIAIAVGSNFRMTPFVTPAPVYVGEPILLSALVSEAGLPVKGCTVTVDATAPDGATSTLQLRDDGAHQDGGADDGEYAHAFTHTAVEGTYHFRFRAVGTSRDGEPVTREALRDKPVLVKGRPPHDGGGKDGGRPPGGGEGGDDCCERLLAAVREQNRLLRRLLERPRIR